MNFSDPLGLSAEIEDINTTAPKININLGLLSAQSSFRALRNQLSVNYGQTNAAKINGSMAADRAAFNEVTDNNMICAGEINRAYDSQDKAALAAYHHILNNNLDRSGGNEYGFSFKQDANGNYVNVSSLRQVDTGQGETSIYFGSGLTGGMHSHPTSGEGLCTEEGSQFLSGGQYAVDVCNHWRAAGAPRFSTSQNPSDVGNISGKASRFPDYVAYLMSGHSDSPQLRKWTLGDGDLGGFGEDISNMISCGDG